MKNNCIKYFIISSFNFFLFLYSTNAFAQKNHYYINLNKINDGDTLGLYKEIFTTKTSLFSTLIQADYLNYAKRTKASLARYSNALALLKKNSPDTLKAIVNARIGNFYHSNDNYTEAIKYFTAASIVYDFKPKNLFQAKMYIMMGQVHHTLGKLSEGLKCYLSALYFFKHTKDKKREAATQNNVALAYMEMNDFNNAEKYFDSCMTYRESVKDYYGIGQTYNNRGTLEYKKENYEKALDYYRLGYEYRIKGNVSENGIIESITNIGKTYHKLKNQNSGLKWLTDALQKAKKINNIELQRRIQDQLREVYLELGDYKSAFESQKEFYTLNDSLFGFDKRLEIENTVLKFEVISKLRQDSLKTQERINSEKMLSAEKEKRSNIILLCLLGGMLFMAFFIFLLFRTNRQRKKTNAIILEQKNAIDSKQKEIVDSITYAQRLQNAILADKSEIEKTFKEHFLIYLPKDIVAGDFYFFEKTEKHIFYAAADCTGHGVPGALVSVVCANALNRCVNEFKLTDSALILNKTRELILETFSRSGDEVKDGMDIALCVIENKNSISTTGDLADENGNSIERKFKLQFAGANNGLWLIRNGKLIEYNPDKMPVGKHDYQNKSFTNHEIDLLENDVVYLCTDGYADQFGGPKSKKFKYAQLQKIIIENSKKSLSEQEKIFLTEFRKWKGKLEQLDDVCLIGFKMI